MKRKNTWVTYPEIELTIDDLKNTIMQEELNDVIITSVVEEEKFNEISKQITEENGEAIEDITENVVSKYVKISPTFHVAFLRNDDEHEIYRVFNPQTNATEDRELTDNEKHEILVKEIKESKIKFRPTKYAVKTTEIIKVPRKIRGFRKEKIKTVLTNITVNKFGAEYRKKRQQKNKAQRASRKANR
jgi:nitrogen regulatory protein PII-like uncharacterized protein